MKICFPARPRPEGGGNYVLMAFIAYLRARNVPVTHDVAARYDVIFTNHWSVPRRTILRGLRRNLRLRLVQRIDGSAQDYGRPARADREQRAVNALADAVIFQSRYARYATREKFPVIALDGPVIYNPVDSGTFRPDGTPHPAVAAFEYGTRVCAASWSANVMKGAPALYETADANPDVGFVLCGNYPDAPDLPNIARLGVLGRDELAAAMRGCAAFVTYSENEACPNVVLEALASGLPVLYRRSGGTPELVAECGRSVEPRTFRAALDEVVAQRVDLSRAARRRALAMFSPERAFGAYVRLIEQVVDNPPRLSLARRLLLAWNPVAVASYGARAAAKRLLVRGR